MEAMNLKDLSNLTLETLIGKNRDKCELRYAGEADLAPLRCELDQADLQQPIKADLSAWTLIALHYRPQPLTHVFLVGVAPYGETMTSAVRGYDAARGLVVTNSGSLYRLEGEEYPDPLPLPRLMYIAATFNTWGAGSALGMPPAFF